MSRSRAYVFTLNNYTEEEEAELYPKLAKCKYASVGREVGKERGTPHLQGVVWFHNAKSFNAARRFLGPRCRVEPVEAKIPSKAINYTQKEGNFKEWGIKPLDPKRKGSQEQERWEDALKAAKEGRLDDIPADIALRYYSTIKRIKHDYERPPQDLAAVTGIWYYGPPGTGKSYTARQKYPDSYIKNQNKWWDGYQGEDSVIIDDFDSAALGHHLKIWADRYAFRAEVKGGTLFIRPTFIIITSNYSIEELFKDDQVLADAIKRRFKCTHFNEPLMS